MWWRREARDGAGDDIFQRLITGKRNKQVAATLGITEGTVKAHRALILRKVAVGSIASRFDRWQKPPSLSA